MYSCDALNNMMESISWKKFTPEFVAITPRQGLSSAKLTGQDFYWPTVKANAEELVRRCQGCQFFAQQTHLLAQALNTIPPPWPFAIWGLDMVGPLAKAPGGFEYLFVAIDKFSKWIEVKPMVKYCATKVAEFIKEIMHRFSIPNRIIIDLGTTFMGNEFWDSCENSGIEVCYAFIAHPRAN